MRNHLELFGPDDLRLLLDPAAVTLLAPARTHRRDTPRLHVCGDGLNGPVVWGKSEEIAQRLGGRWVSLIRASGVALARPDAILWARPYRRGTQLYVRAAGMVMTANPYDHIAAEAFDRHALGGAPPDLDARR